MSDRKLTSWSLRVLLLCIAVAGLPAQSATAQAANCFNIRVRLNGKHVEGPQVVTLKTKQHEIMVARDEGCIKLPPDLLSEKAVDVVFIILGNKVQLSAIAGEFFAGFWDVELADKTFETDISLPKHARAREACAVVFHLGDPETAMLQTGCRTALPVSATK